MRSISVLLVCSLALTCAGESSCATDVADGGDDRCQLLQGGVGIVSHHKAGEASHKADADAHAAEKIASKLEALVSTKGKHHAHASTDATDKGFPDIFKKITDAIGGVGQLEEDFEAVKTVVRTFSTEVHTAVVELRSNVKPSMTVDDIKAQVAATYEKIHTSALKLWQALTKVSSDFLTGIGHAAPEQFKSTVNNLLESVTLECKNFADTFSDAANELKKVNQSMVCATVQQNVHSLHQKVDEFVQSALNMTTKSLPGEITKAKEALPETIQKEVDKFLAKADEAAESIMKSVNPTVQELAEGIVNVFHGHCKDLKSSAGRLEVGLLSALLLGILGFFA